MHSATQTLAHRAPATRTKPRWQPYASTPSTSFSIPIRSPPLNHLHTPYPSVQPSPKISTHINEFNRLRQTTSQISAQQPKDLPQRDSSKTKFAAGLVDQAVKTLSDIWRPDDIPRIFLPPVKPNTLPTNTGPIIGSTTHKYTQSSSISDTSISTISPPPFTTQFSPGSASVSTAMDPTSSLIPIRSFVHEVLRRSRTSGNVLQTALCYLEGIRSKVPELRQEDHMGTHAHFEPESRIMPATAAELAREAEFAAAELHYDSSDDTVKTIKVDDLVADDFESSSQFHDAPSTTVVAAPVADFLPSPLLCPRRAFLASLILASKFSQDKCYSNRAWAKLSGLPAREIGRCERALGQALEWRLWVGKRSVSSLTTSSSLPSVRTVARSQSEGSISASSSVQGPFLIQEQRDSDILKGPTAKVLRRHATVPAEAFTLSNPAASAQGHSLVNNGIISGEDRSLLHSVNNDAAIARVLTQSPDYAAGSVHTSPRTPGLTYSPSSSSSDTSGSQTIQMSGLDDNMLHLAGRSWSDMAMSSPAKQPGYPNSMCDAGFAGGISSGIDITFVNAELGSFGVHPTRCVWPAEAGHSVLDPVGVC